MTSGPKIAFPFTRDQLVAYRAAGLTCREIAERHMTSPSTVRDWCWIWQAPRVVAPSTRARAEALDWHDLVRRHGGAENAGRVVGVSRTMARKCATAQGVRLVRGGQPRLAEADAVRARVVELFVAGHGRREIARAVGRSVQRVDQIRRAAGVWSKAPRSRRRGRAA